MTLATRPFGNLFNFSRNSTKWEMGPNGKFIEYPVGAPAYRHDPVTGGKLGISFNESVTTLQSNSLAAYTSVNFDTSDAISLFEGKVAKRVANLLSSPSAGVGYSVGPLPSRGGNLRSICGDCVHLSYHVRFPGSGRSRMGGGVHFRPGNRSLKPRPGINIRNSWIPEGHGLWAKRRRGLPPLDDDVGAVESGEYASRVSLPCLRTRHVPRSPRIDHSLRGRYSIPAPANVAYLG